MFGAGWSTAAATGRSPAASATRPSGRSPASSTASEATASSSRYRVGMCRNIRALYNFEPAASREEIRDAALQYVRKVSGMQKPSQANAEAFEAAVGEVADATARLLETLVTSAPAKDREVEAERRRARSAV